MAVEQLKPVTLPVRGMTCASCVTHVEGALKEVDGVIDARVNLATEKATVEYDARLAGLSALVKAIDGSGYKVGSDRVTLTIGGMTCASCVGHIENALKETEEIGRASGRERV